MPSSLDKRIAKYKAKSAKEIRIKYAIEYKAKRKPVNKLSTSKKKKDKLRKQFRLEQDNRCAICGDFFFQRKTCLDHCHTTKRYRGLLCYNCNTGIGKLKENLMIIARAIEYISKWKDEIYWEAIKKKYPNGADDS